MNQSLKPDSWISEIVLAYKALGGSALYEKVYQQIANNTKRELTPKWKSTIQRTVEDHSSDSANFRGKDLFRKVGRGHWELRDSIADPRANIEPSANKSLLNETNATNVSSDSVLEKLVYVREHWRRWPVSPDGEDVSFQIDKAVFEVVSACVTDTHFELTLATALVLKVPFSWYQTLLNATPAQLVDFEFGEYGVHWRQLDFEVFVPEILASGATKFIKVGGVCR